MEVKASLNHFHIAPRKVRLVVNLIKGMEVKRAELELKNLSKRFSLPLLKLLKSALANAKNNFEFGERNFYIKELRVDSGSMLKRYRPRAFGRAAMIRKRTSHVNLTLATREVFSAKTRKKSRPIIKEIEATEVIKGDLGIKPKSDFRPSKKTQPTKKTGFVSRFFRRKAI